MLVRPAMFAYAVPPVLALFLAFLGLVQVSEAGVVGASSVVTAAPGANPGANSRVAAALQRVARAEHATIVRIVADRAAPTTRRTMLVTDAPDSRGAHWLQDHPGDFSRSVTTEVASMSALVQYDPTGSYDVFGGDHARRATIAALADVGYEATSDRVPWLQRLGITAGVVGATGLIGTLVLGCVVLCLTSTVGAPRRIAVQRLHGWSLGRVLLAELSDGRVGAVVVAVVTPPAMVGLWLYNELASATTLAAAVAVLWAALLIPVVASHVIGALVASRLSMVGALRGARPATTVTVLAQIARVPALLLLVGAVFDLSGAVAMSRAGSAERDLRAAGDTVQLWVTPDPRPIGTQAYWDRIGDFTGRSLDRGDAVLAAPVEVATGVGTASTPALIVDAEYLRLRDVRAEDGKRIAAGDRVSVWLPARSDLRRAPLERALARWELRDAPEDLRHDLRGGTLAAEPLYSYPGDASSRAWLDDAVLVVVPDPSAVFTADQLGSWLSSGDVVFTTRTAAERSIQTSDVAAEFSAVVSVGQAAAEQVRQATAGVVIGVAAVSSSALVGIVLMVLGTIAHRRRNGRRMFARFAAGESAARVDAGPWTTEAVLLLIAVIFSVNTWWEQRPDETGRHSALDPVAASSGTAGVLSVLALSALSVVSTVVLAVTARHVTRTRGNGSR